ncbi:large subunit ribosomal protein L17 [Marchantia polymorpha subsp. ruderalis]|uniref:Large ribosomal subunit protein bL17c n=1 Tax=Marchantia polymorpha TaxID=3197 RepID=A0A2R6XIS2_MARPO|nr:hypothetical protein MARPO_0013s0204 [Marchantia polymorpha]BBN18830.1 hypothetical protein Mp_8g05860 [Marchantia polymorpha subsp. ruderalis]|eukprot:PTQ46014.1 hypothetical protein MARPO_0013s0204 [Marchantia polymorpha]
MAGAFCLAALGAALPTACVSSRVSVSSKVRVSCSSGRNVAVVSRRRSHVSAVAARALPAFQGLRTSNALGFRTESTFDNLTLGVNNGSRWFAMRHRVKGSRLGRPADQRRALLRGLTTELLRHGRIKTTKARARAMRKYVDHMITLAKGGSLHQRRQALGFLYDKTLVHSIFAEVPDRYGERNGGYTRIIRTMPRRGDNAPMAFIELV